MVKSWFPISIEKFSGRLELQAAQGSTSSLERKSPGLRRDWRRRDAQQNLDIWPWKMPAIACKSWVVIGLPSPNDRGKPLGESHIVLVEFVESSPMKPALSKSHRGWIIHRGMIPMVSPSLGFSRGLCRMSDSRFQMLVHGCMMLYVLYLPIIHVRWVRCI